jgi:hypothetical protein
MHYTCFKHKAFLSLVIISLHPKQNSLLLPLQHVLMHGVQYGARDFKQFIASCGIVIQNVCYYRMAETALVKH